MCFTLAWLETILVYLVIVGAVFAILRLLVPYVLGAFGAGGGVVASAVQIAMWAIVAILVIYVCFGLIGCLLSGPSLLPHR